MTKAKWTQQEDDLIKEKYESSTKEELLGLLPHRTWKAIVSRASIIGASSLKSWTKDENDVIEKYYRTTDKYKLKELLPHRSWHAITLQAQKKLGLKSQKYWTDRDIQILIENYQDTPNIELLDLFPGRNEDSIQNKAIELGIKKSYNFRPKFQGEFRQCEQCGKMMRAQQCKIRDGFGKYCSNECNGLALRNRIIRECRKCGKMMEIIPAKIKLGEGSFCSLKCYHTAKGDTSIEFMIEEEIKKLGFTYEKKKQISKWNADFYIPHLNLVVECDGDYWHNRPGARKKDKRKDLNLRKRGYDVVRIWEHEIKKDPENALLSKLPSLQASLF